MGSVGIPLTPKNRATGVFIMLFILSCGQGSFKGKAGRQDPFHEDHRDSLDHCLEGPLTGVGVLKDLKQGQDDNLEVQE